MKNARFQRRFYRDWVYPKGLYTEEIVVKETDVQILTNKPLDRAFVLRRIGLYRGAIEDYINYKDKRFLTSLKPIAVELRAEPIVREMARQAFAANVGPMAAVAGAIAQFVGRDILRKGYTDVIVENGGDIFMRITRDIRVGFYHGKNSVLNSLRLKIKPRGTPLGICASSGTVGHSLSFGIADSVVVAAGNAALADAVATAAANRVNAKGDCAGAIDFARSIKGIRGVIVVLGNHMAGWGSCFEIA
ncbi:MAG: UPF0280 family protein [Candidatus Omnitrophota bacterium]|jgi:hypothetical protein